MGTIMVSHGIFKDESHIFMEIHGGSVLIRSQIFCDGVETRWAGRRLLHVGMNAQIDWFVGRLGLKKIPHYAHRRQKLLAPEFPKKNSLGNLYSQNQISSYNPIELVV